MAEVRISPRDGNPSPVLLDVGDVLAVDVPENPTTGYVWSVAALPGMLAELPPDAHPDAGAATGPPPPGAAGERILRFTAQQPGTGELRLRHARLWQPEGGEDLVVEVRVE